MPRDQVDPVLLELFKHRFAAVCEEMGVTLQRTAFSANIKERLDFSCALFNAAGEMVAQAAHIPVHLGSMPLTVQQVVRDTRLAPGDVVILNDPYRGGTHLPDLTMLAPVHLTKRGRPEFYVANRAHHADIGGATPGSMAPTTEIYQEGLVIPPVHLVRAGRMEREVLDFVLANVRGRVEREGDFAAQLAAVQTGISRVRELVAGYGRRRVGRYATALVDYAERLMRATLRALPDGGYAFSDAMDDDGVGGPPPRVRAHLEIRGDTVVVDFTGSAPQVPGNLNAVYAITASAVFYVFRCLAPAHTPSNGGIARPLRIVAPPGSIVNASPPAGVAGGNVETSQRIVDVLLGALAQACPDRIPAASAGTMTNVAFGGRGGVGHGFAYYETIAGGMGGRPDRRGLDAVHTHMTNTMNTPVEALEHAYPVRVERYEIRRRSGGRGRHPGGNGLVRAVRFLEPATVSLLADRHARGPYGLAGGLPGRPGRAYLLRAGKRRSIASKTCLQMQAGDVIELHTPGGGGWGAT